MGESRVLFQRATGRHGAVACDNDVDRDAVCAVRCFALVVGRPGGTRYVTPQAIGGSLITLSTSDGPWSPGPAHEEQCTACNTYLDSGLARREQLAQRISTLPFSKLRECLQRNKSS